MHSGEITRKSTVQELFFYLTRYLSLTYIIKLSQTILEIWPAQDICFRGDNYIMKKVRVVSFTSNMSTGPPLHSYQILSKYVYGYQSYGEHKDASSDRWMDRSHADRYIP